MANLGKTCPTCHLLESTVKAIGRCGLKVERDDEPCLHYDLLADEAEQGYHDPSGYEPTLPEIWIAELIAADGTITSRLVLTNQGDANQALSPNWRIVRYVRADRASTQ